MLRKQKNNITLLNFNNLKEHNNLTHFISTRMGGFSTGKYNSLNLSFKADPNTICTLKNRQHLFESANLLFETLTLGKQVHSSNITIVTADISGSGSSNYQSALSDTDALLTSVPGVAIAVLVADCTPILLFDPVKKIIGAIHAGRMGTISQISRKTVEKMVIQFSTNPANLKVGIGPSICPMHYSISVEAQDQITNTLGRDYLIKNLDGSIGFDLCKANTSQLVTAGVRPENIEMSNLCTFENPELFFSERREGKPTGRFCAAICMNSV